MGPVPDVDPDPTVDLDLEGTRARWWTNAEKIQNPQF